MQDEILKHTEKIYKTVKDSKHTFGEKVKEIIIEIFIIVFAVTLSIWLHSWSEHRHQQEEVKEFLTDLQDDLKNDIKNISKSNDNLSKFANNFRYLANLTHTQADSLRQVHGDFTLNSTIFTTKISNGNYEGFKSSGKIGFIEDKLLKRQILRYYQEQIERIAEAEKSNNSSSQSLIDFVEENADKDNDKILMSPKFKEKLKMQIQDSEILLVEYRKSLEDANNIIKEIEKTTK